MIEKRKKALKIMNAAIVLICVLSIASYVLAPFWTLKISYDIDTEMISDMINDSFEGSDYKINSKEIAGSDGITLSISIRLKSRDIIKSLFAEDDSTVKNYIVNEIAEDILKSIKPLISEVSSKVVKSVAKEAVKEQLAEKIEESLGEGTDTEKVMDDLGITDEIISEKTEKLFEMMDSGEATVDSVAEYIADTVNDFFGSVDLKNYPEYAGISEIGDISPENIKEALKETFTDANLVNEDGTIKDMESFIDSVLKQNPVPNLTDKEETENKSEEINFTNLAVKSEPGTLFLSNSAFSSETENENSLSETVKTMLNDTLSDKTVAFLANVIKVMAAIMIISAVSWAILLVKAIVKTLNPKVKNPGCRMGLPIFLGWINQLYLGYILTGLMKFVTSGKMQSVISGYPDELKGIGLVSVTSGLIPSICAFVLIFLFIPYRKMRRFIKKSEKKVI